MIFFALLELSALAGAIYAMMFPSFRARGRAVRGTEGKFRGTNRYLSLIDSNSQPCSLVPREPFLRPLSGETRGTYIF